jgi:hypothetical protein
MMSEISPDALPEFVWGILGNLTRLKPTGEYTLKNALYLKDGKIQIKVWAEIFLNLLDFAVASLEKDSTSPPTALVNAVGLLEEELSPKKTKYFKIMYGKKNLYFAFLKRETRRNFRSFVEEALEKEKGAKK